MFERSIVRASGRRTLCGTQPATARQPSQAWRGLVSGALSTLALLCWPSAGYSQGTGLVAAYSFNEGAGTTVADVSGNNNNGALNAGVTWTAQGKYGNALVFNGTSALVTIPDSPNLRLTSAMTLEAWVMPTAVSSAWRDVVYKGNDNYYLEVTSKPASRPAAGATGTVGEVYGLAALTANTWSHLAVTYDGAALRLYVNGVQVSSAARTGAIATSANPLQIGGDSIYGQYFQGTIDEVRVYNRALSQAEIQTDMNTAIGGAPPSDTVPPTVAITTPTAAGTYATTTSPLALGGTAGDNIGVTQVSWSNDRGGSGTASGTTNWSVSGVALQSGTNVLSVTARDAANNTASATLTVTYTPSDPTPPSVSITGPATGATVSGTTTVTASASDNVAVVGVQFLLDGAALGAEQPGPSFSLSWDTRSVANGGHTLSAQARDAAGNVAIAVPVSITVSNSQPLGLVAAYSFSEGAGTAVADASGNGNNGTLNAGVTWSTQGKFGNALVFNGTSGLVTIADSASLRLTNGMTLEAWVNPSAVTPAWRDAVYKGNDNYYLEATSSQSGRPAAGAIGTVGEVYGAAPLTTNTWTHLAVTYDSATLRLYVNGVQASSAARTGSIATSANPLQVGGDSIYGQYFQGMIDEVRVYNRALTQAEIQADMNAPVGTGPSDTVAPTVNITSPTSAGTFATGGSLLALGGTAGDNLGVTQVTWTNDRGGSGTASGTTNWSVSGVLLQSGTNVLTVTAKDAAGNAGTATLTVTYTPDTTPPSAPGTLSAVAVTGTQVNLSWGSAQDNLGVNDYRVERCQGAGCSVFVKLAVIPSTPATFVDTGLAPNTSYSYVVRAEDGAGNLGPYSNVATVTTLADTPELVAAYSFEEGTGTILGDSSGKGNHGTIQNATWTSAGKYGMALVFNGTNALVTIPDSPSLRLTNAMTLEAWVNPSAVSSAWRDAVYKGNDNYYLEATSSQSGRPAAGASGSVGEVYGLAALGTNTWTHLAVTYDGAALRLYVNGVQVSSVARTGTMAISANPLQIGGDSIFGQYFQGMIDEVRVYNVARTPTQIQTDAYTPIGAVGLPVVSLAPTSLSFGSQQVNTTSSPQVVTVTNTGSGTMTLSSIAVLGANSTDFNQGNSCGSTLAAGSNCLISITFTPLAGGNRAATLTLSDNAPGSPHTVPLSGTGSSGVVISPSVSVLTAGQTQQFTASLSGVVWSVDGVVGGNATTGTITTNGLYTPPNVAGTHTVSATTADQLKWGSATVYVSAYAGVFTHHNDNARTGQNLNETVLTPANVSASSFGKLFSYQLDGIAHASPLYVAGVNIPGLGLRNVVYVATEHDSVYAFDADGRSAAPLWKVSFTNPAAGITVVPPGDTGECCDISPEIGITGTPVIDPATGTLYVVVKTKEISGGTTRYVQRLHALDVATGAEKLGGPVVIQGGALFDPLKENQRPALLLNNGVVYIAFASHGDYLPYHGFVLGYNATTLQQAMAFCASPNDKAGIWMGNAGPAADSAGNIYFPTANGHFNPSTGDYGSTLIKLSPSGVVLDYFTPSNQSTLDSQNLDLASAGTILLPDQPGAHPHLALVAGKNANIHLVDRDNMGKYNGSTDTSVQSLWNIFPYGTPEPGNYSAPVYFNGTVYYGPVADAVKAFRLNNGLLPTVPTSQSQAVFAYPGATLSVSANGTANAILWAVERTSVSTPGVLHAYDPSNLANEYYNTNQAGTRDALDVASKFSVPVVANGKVFVGAASMLVVYGLLP